MGAPEVGRGGSSEKEICFCPSKIDIDVKSALRGSSKSEVLESGLKEEGEIADILLKAGGKSKKREGTRVARIKALPVKGSLSRFSRKKF
jgi:hypothetical protein